MSDVIDINDEAEFNNAISNGTSVIELWAPWCGPCKIQGPLYEQVASESFKSGIPVKFYKSNIEECSSIASRFGIRSIPCLLLFKEGQEIGTLIGTQRKAAIVEAVTKALAGELSS